MHFIALCICMHIYVCKYMCIYIYITIHAEVNFFNKISHYFSGMSEFASPHPTWAVGLDEPHEVQQILMQSIAPG